MNKMISFGGRLNPPYNPIAGVVEKVSCPDVAEPNKQLFDLIYTPDPATGLPCGDIAVFLSENANPQVKQFIETSLLKPVSDGSSGLSLPQDVLNKFGQVINDDDIAYFSRNHGETDEEFADRMRLFMENEKRQLADNKRTAEWRKIVEKAKKNVS